MCVRVYAYTHRHRHTHTRTLTHTNTHQNALSSDDAPRYPLPWKSAAQLSLLLTDPLSGRQERRAISTPLPARRAGSEAAPAHTMRQPVVLRCASHDVSGSCGVWHTLSDADRRDVGVGTNHLEVKSCGDRVAIMVLCVCV